MNGFCYFGSVAPLAGSVQSLDGVFQSVPRLNNRPWCELYASAEKTRRFILSDFTQPCRERYAEASPSRTRGQLTGLVHQSYVLHSRSRNKKSPGRESRTPPSRQTISARKWISFIGFSVGVQSVSAAPLGSPGDAAFSIRSCRLLPPCGAPAIGTTHCRAEAMRSLVAALRPVADRMHPCWKYTPNQIQTHRERDSRCKQVTLIGNWPTAGQRVKWRFSANLPKVGGFKRLSCSEKTEVKRTRPSTPLCSTCLCRPSPHGCLPSPVRPQNQVRRRTEGELRVRLSC